MKPKSMWPLFIAEFVGTALLLCIGLSFVILNWGEGSFVAKWIPSTGARKLITGFLFGSTGCLITLSPVGKISGSHINPAMSLAFWLRGKMKTSALIGYVIAQMTGAVVGCIPLLLWGNHGRSIQYGITLPQNENIHAAFVGELFTTSALIITVFVFAGSKRLRNYTPFTIPFLYCFMVWAETSYSGCSTNPARSFGPAFIAQYFHSYWIYIVAPLLSSIIVSLTFRACRLHELLHLKAARLSYHNHPTNEAIKSGGLMPEKN